MPTSSSGSDRRRPASKSFRRPPSAPIAGCGSPAIGNGTATATSGCAAPTSAAPTATGARATGTTAPAAGSGSAAAGTEAAPAGSAPPEHPSQALRLDWDPDLEAAVPGRGIEALAIALEVGRVRRLVAGLGQPLVPDGIHGVADGRDVLALREHGVALGGKAHAGELARQVREVGDLDAGDIVEVPLLVGVAADA